MPSALPDSLVARFTKDLRAATGDPAGLRYGLCVSGGPDSVALLLLAHGAGLDCAVATVDHGLRSESIQEAADVAALCAKFGLDHATLKLVAPVQGNLSAWARRERYAALGDWAAAQGLHWLLTAHHADDQLETMIMRLNRGSGVAGLAGVRGQRKGVARPLLGWRKAALETLVKQAGVTVATDPSNHDDRFDRARLRKALAGADWLDPVAAARSAAALAQAEEALDWTAQAYANRRMAEQDGVVSLDPKNLPRELQRRLVLICLRALVPEANPRGEELDRLLAGLAQGRIATLAGVRCTGGTFWLFAKAAPHRA